MEIRPILSTLGRHKTAAALIVLEVALSCAIVCNALFMIGNRLERMHRISGLAEDQIVRVQITGIGQDENSAARTREDLAALRALPGVKAASMVNEVVYGNSSWSSSINLAKDQDRPTVNATVYMADEQFVDTLGLHVVAGRAFLPDEFLDFDPTRAATGNRGVPAVIITRSLAERLFPGQNALGKSIYSWGDFPIPIVGIVDHLMRPNDEGGEVASQYSMVFPFRISYGLGSNYLLRTDPSHRAEVQKAAVAALMKNSPNRLVMNQGTLTDLRADYYKRDRSMAWMLVIAIAALLVVTALGIVGLASFWVQQRTRQIGVRRALGATRGQILRYFQTENFLLVTAGLVLGMLLAYALNQLLMAKGGLPRLPLYYLPAGAVVLWLLGQCSVLGPARRASSVPPAIATRSA
jgi:putative ABC transport system permease protein